MTLVGVFLGFLVGTGLIVTAFVIIYMDSGNVFGHTKEELLLQGILSFIGSVLILSSIFYNKYGFHFEEKEYDLVAIIEQENVYKIIYKDADNLMDSYESTMFLSKYIENGDSNKIILTTRVDSFGKKYSPRITKIQLTKQYYLSAIMNGEYKIDLTDDLD